MSKHYDDQGRRIIKGHPSTWPAEVEQLKVENRELYEIAREGLECAKYWRKRARELQAELRAKSQEDAS